MDDKRRCDWGYDVKDAALREKILLYHDTRWCKPEHRENELYAMLVLEGMQAGLSWSLILAREEGIRAAFDGLDPRAVALYGEEKIEALLRDERIIRNRRKVEAAVSNARAFLRVEEEDGSFDSYIWGFTGGEVIDHHRKESDPLIAQDELSRRVSRSMKKRGFSFVGPTVVYSYLQGIGVINDHLDSCEFR